MPETNDRKRAEELVREWNDSPAGMPLDAWDEALVDRITTFASEVRAEQRERIEQLQRRVKIFQEGYRDKAFEVIALDIQILDIKATGYDARMERNFEKMKRRCLVAIEERNEARATSIELLKFAEHAPHCTPNTRYPSPPCDCGLSLLWLAATNPEKPLPAPPIRNEVEP